MGVKVREKVRGSNIWWLFVSHKGVRKSKKIGTKHEAQKVAKMVIQNLTADDMGFLKKQVKPFRIYCQDWLNISVPVSVRETTAAVYKAIIEHQLRLSTFYNRPIDKISKLDMQDFFDFKRATLSWSTTSQIKYVCSAVFNRAIDDDTITKNLCRGTKVVKSSKSKEFTTHNREEIQRLLDVFKDTEYYTMVLFFVRTGCRASEVAGLKWEDIDIKTRVATIRRGYVRGKIVETTKSKKNRTIDLTPDLVAQLRLRRKQQLADAGQKSVWVFQRKGKLINMNNFRVHAYSKKLAEAGLKPSRLHDLRHSYASYIDRRNG